MEAHQGYPTTTRELRSFAFIVGGGFVVLWAFRFMVAGHAGIPLIGVSVVLIICGACRPPLLRRPYRWWMTIGDVMGRVMSPLLLSAVYFIVLTPLALLRRLLIRDPLELRRNRDAASYFHPKHAQSREQFQRMF